MGTQVADPAASTTATPNFNPETFTPEQHTAWMEKGEIPQEPAAAAEPAKPVTESAPVSQQEPKPPAARNADERKAELSRDIQEHLDRRRALGREWQEFEEWKGKKGATDAAPPAAAQPAELKEPPTPTWGEIEGETWAQFEKRQAKHVADLVDYKLTLKDRERETESRKAADAAAEKATQESWQERLETAKSQHSDYAEVAFSAETPITDAIHIFLMESPLGAEILYKLGENGSAEGKRIAQLSPLRTVAELAKIEASLEKPAEPQKPPAAPITKAAKPSTNLKATNPAPVDEMRAAVEADDITRFMEIQNQRDVDRRKRR